MRATGSSASNGRSCPAKAKALVKSLRNSKLVEHAAKDLLRAARLPLLPSDESHVDEDLKRIHKGKALAPVLLVRGDIATGLPLIVADGVVTLRCEEARGIAPCGFSSGRDDLVPRTHRCGA